MNKTIYSISQTTNHHPALGPVFKVEFTDYTQDLVYAETFFHQIDGWYSSTHKYGIEWLIGKTINISEDYYSID